MRHRVVGLVIALVLGILVALPAAEAQQRGKIPLVGVLEPGPQLPVSGCLTAFQQGLRDLGYVEGQNITFAYRYAEGQQDRLPALAAELVQLTPDVLWTISGVAVRAAKQATTTIPIIIGVATELVEQGFVESLARPGGNLTGLDIRDLELLGKRLELLREAIPTISRVAVLVNAASRHQDQVPNNIEPEARALGVQLQRVEADGPETFEGAFATMVQGGANALMILEAAPFARHRQRLAELALQHRLPTMTGSRSFAEAGSLLAYGVSILELCQRSAVFVDKILKGAKPATLPVERAYKFSLVVNLKTAQALGLTLSPVFLLRADETIE
jgi:putative ABC transport system substrate-binding protein